MLLRHHHGVAQAGVMIYQSDHQPEGRSYSAALVFAQILVGVGLMVELVFAPAFTKTKRRQRKPPE